MNGTAKPHTKKSKRAISILKEENPEIHSTANLYLPENAVNWNKHLWKSRATTLGIRR